jgi:hypothetical protein
MSNVRRDNWRRNLGDGRRNLGEGKKIRIWKLVTGDS